MATRSASAASASSRSSSPLAPPKRSRPMLPVRNVLISKPGSSTR
jgi:hypothetical protein